MRVPERRFHSAAAMVSRKRARSEMEAEPPNKPAEGPSLLQRIRSCWEFASLMQYIFIFGKVMKIDEDLGIEVCFALLPHDIEVNSETRTYVTVIALDLVANCELYLQNEFQARKLTIEIMNCMQDLEIECLKPEPSDRLLDIGLSLLKFVSSHRGLTYVISVAGV